MLEAKEFLGSHWFGLALFVAALGLGGLSLWRKRRTEAWSLSLLLSGSACALVGIGGLAVPFNWGLWLGAGMLVILFGMLLVVITSGWWNALAGYCIGVCLFLAGGAVCCEKLGQWITDGFKTIASLEPTQPWWLLLLLLIPLIIYLSYSSLAGLGPVRRWIAIGLRCSLIMFLTLALSEVRLRHQNETTTVLFVVDRSLSIPEDFDPAASPDSTRVDLRADRVEKFINESVRARGAEHKNDFSGLILFGRRPRLELPASNSPRFNFKFKDAASNIDGNYTDIAAAMKLALASFPEGSGKRVVLISDGNENLGNAEEQARIAKLNGVQIDVVPLATGYRNENEVLVQSVEAPPKTEQGSRLPIRVLLRSYNPRGVIGTLLLKQITDGETVPVAPSPRRVRLKPGLNAFQFQQPLTNQSQSYTYQAVFQPEGVEDERGEGLTQLEGDRVQNNSATTHVVALGQRRILVIEPAPGDHQLLIDRLKTIGNSKYKVFSITPQRLPENKAELGVFLSNYDCVLLANVPAELITDEQQEMLRSNTHDQGCGLVMIGGPDSFGAGGWQNTPIEKALPVDCEIKSFKVQPKGGLVLVMHACEMAQGNDWEHKIAKLAIEKLSAHDEIGIIHYDFGGHKWHIPLQQIRNRKRTLLALVDRMVPGDMPDFDTPLKMAYDSLTDPKRALATKHIIIISDGDPQLTNRNTLAKMKQDKVTCTTVGVATHGMSFDQNLTQIAQGASPGGKFYKVESPRALPSIYIKETRIVSRSFVSETKFEPRLLIRGGPTERLPQTLPPLYGYVRSTPKQSPLVQMSIVGPPQPDQDFPILAHWTYGLGRSVAFTSDARSLPNKPAWDREWAGSDIYSKFWEQVVDFALRPTETGKMVMTTEYNDGKVKVVIDARDSNNRPINDLLLQGGITSPSLKPDDARKLELRFEQKNSGLYEAEFKADEAGSYFVNAQAKRKVTELVNGKEVTREEVDSVRAGVTIPYSPEFSDLESNSALLEKIRDMTGGETINELRLAKAADLRDPDADSEKSSLASQVFRAGLPQFKNLQPVWFWLVFYTGVLFFFDIGIRRIAIQPSEAVGSAVVVWQKLRGRAAAAVQSPQFINRLQSRKAAVSETLEQLRSARRFEPGEKVAAHIPSSAEATAASNGPSLRAAPRQRLAPDGQQEPADFASRLLKAKKKVWEERDKEHKN